MQWIADNWRMICGMLLLVSFFPLTVCSYHVFRLPKKRQEFNKIRKRLVENKIEDPNTFSIIDEKFRWGDYCLPLLFVTVFTFLGFYLLFDENGKFLLAGVELVHKSIKEGSKVAIGMAFLGAYVWSIRYIFVRLMTIDLPPGAFYSVGIRMAFAAFVALVFYYFALALPIRDQTLVEMTPVVAFITGIFPQRVLNYMVEYFKFSASDSKKRAHALPLDMLEGITAFHKVRLSEMGIDNVQNLVKASLVELMLKTPYKPRQLIDWMVQGRLCIQFKTDVNKLREAGVRTILGFKIIGDSHKLDELSKLTNIDRKRLEVVYRIIKDSPALDRLTKAKDCLHMI